MSLASRGRRGDERETCVAMLHECYLKRKLRILAGNGLSMASGFPSWEELNLSLLHQLVQRDANAGNVWAPLLSPILPELSKSLLGVLGRDGAADFVALAFKNSDKFKHLVRTALYKGRSSLLLPLSAAHYQLASMRNNAQLATTNFDPLLELAASKLGAGDWQQLRSSPGNADRQPGRIEHLHGWIDPPAANAGDPEPLASETFILTESDYFRLAAEPDHAANQRLTQFFTEPGATLVAGMSMADMNIRRILFLLSNQVKRKQSSIYLVLKEKEPLVDNYTAAYWKNRGLHLLFIQSHQELSGLLRDIQWGLAPRGEAPPWVTEAVEWRAGNIPDPVIFGDDWQTLACNHLRQRRDQLRRMFGMPAEETCELALFVPIRNNSEQDRIFLNIVATSKHCRKRNEAIEHARNRRLSIGRLEEQGVAGIAFSRGVERESVFGDQSVDHRFSGTMRSAWVSDAGYRDWRTILAVPLVGGPDSLPLAVVTVNSNSTQPFWSKLESSQTLRRELISLLEDSCKWLLEKDQRHR